MPQIEIMQSDLPHTLYKPIKKKKRPNTNSNYRVNPSDRAFALQEEANKRAKNLRRAKAEGKVPYTVDTLFKR